MEQLNPYTTLGVPPDANTDTIKKAYRKLAAQYHPDRNSDSNAEEQFKAVNSAYDILKDPNKRKHFDASQQRFDYASAYTRGFTVEDILNEFMQRDFNFRASPFQQPRGRNRDISVSYSITLEEAYQGKESDIHYIVPNEGRRTTHIRVPAGVEHGTKIRYAGLGENADDSVPNGDLYVAIQIKPHAMFDRSGCDLTVRMMIDALDAMTDAEIEVPTIDGKIIKITLPAGLQSGQIVRVAGHGMPNMRSDVRGDLYLHISIKIPNNLTDEEKHILRQMREGVLRMHE